MTTSMKKQLVTRLVGTELQGWRAGWKAGQKCALKHLTTSAFEAVTSLDQPTFDDLKAAMGDNGLPNAFQHPFWNKVVNRFLHCEVTALPDFPLAFVEAVRAVWDEVREDVMAELEASPRPRQTEEPATEHADDVPVRPIRRGRSRRRASPRPDLHRRW